MPARRTPAYLEFRNREMSNLRENHDEKKKREKEFVDSHVRRTVKDKIRMRGVFGARARARRLSDHPIDERRKEGGRERTLGFTDRRA